MTSSGKSIDDYSDDYYFNQNERLQEKIRSALFKKEMRDVVKNSHKKLNKMTSGTASVVDAHDDSCEPEDDEDYDSESENSEKSQSESEVYMPDILDESIKENEMNENK